MGREFSKKAWLQKLLVKLFIKLLDLIIVLEPKTKLVKAITCHGLDQPCLRTHLERPNDALLQSIRCAQNRTYAATSAYLGLRVLDMFSFAECIAADLK